MSIGIVRLLSANLLAFFCICIAGCSEWFMDDPVRHNSPPSVFPSSMKDVISAESSREYEKLCIRTEYYFCPGVSGPLMRIKITKDVCKDPPVILSMSECEEYLECNPHVHVIGESDCITELGYPGVYVSYCIKGFIQDGPCEGTYLDDLKDVYDNVASPPGENLDDEIYDPGPSDNESTCMKQDTDILFILDLSASMIPEIQAVFNFVEEFSSQYEDVKHIKWALVVGPKNAGQKPGNHNFLYLASDLSSSDMFQYAMSQVLQYQMIGQYEMLYDALYLSIRNLSSFLPYQWEELLWPVWVGNVIDESVPPLDEFYIQWREKSKRVIIVFTDEPGQSFLMPSSKVGKTYNTNDTITQEKLAMMLSSIDDIRLYTFTDLANAKPMSSWSSLSSLTSGASFEITGDQSITLKQLGEIFEGEICY